MAFRTVVRTGNLKHFISMK